MRRNEFEPRHGPSGFGKKGGGEEVLFSSSSFRLSRQKREGALVSETLLARIIKPKRLIMRSPSLVTPFQGEWISRCAFSNSS